MLTDGEVKKIAKLARIEISDQDTDKLKEELSSILDFVNKLNAVNTEEVEPLYQTTGLTNSVRPDEDREEFKMDKSLEDKLVGQAPHTENNFVKVRSVLNK